MTQTLQVTKCAAAYQELTEDRVVAVDVETVDNVMPVDPKLGIGRSVIYFLDGTTMNVLESVDELYERGLRT